MRKNEDFAGNPFPAKIQSVPFHQSASAANSINSLNWLRLSPTTWPSSLVSRTRKYRNETKKQKQKKVSLCLS